MVVSDDDLLNELHEYYTKTVRDDFTYLRKEYMKMASGESFALDKSKYVFVSRTAQLDNLDALFHAIRMLPGLGRRLSPIKRFRTLWKKEGFDALTSFRAIVEGQSHLHQLLAQNRIVPLDLKKERRSAAPSAKGKRKTLRFARSAAPPASRSQKK